MKSMLITSGIVALGITAIAILAGAAAGDAADGKAIFLKNKCNACHSITSQGIARTGEFSGKNLPPDLSGVGLKHTADWMRGWLLKTQEMDGKKHLKKWSGNPQD